MKKAEFLHRCSICIHNTITDEYLLQRVGLFGYPPEKMQDGAQLLDACILADQQHQRKQGQAIAASNKRDTLKQKAEVIFRDFVGLAKVALKTDKKACNVLGLFAKKETNLKPWLIQRHNFYTQLSESNVWMEAMARYGQTTEKIKEGEQLILQVETLNRQAILERAESQVMRADRDKLFDQLQEWVRDFMVIARIALSENPQLLEKMGIVVKS